MSFASAYQHFIQSTKYHDLSKKAKVAFARDADSEIAKYRYGLDARKQLNITRVSDTPRNTRAHAPPDPLSPPAANVTDDRRSLFPSTALRSSSSL